MLLPILLTLESRLQRDHLAAPDGEVFRLERKLRVEIGHIELELACRLIAADDFELILALRLSVFEYHASLADRKGEVGIVGLDDVISLLVADADDAQL